MKKKSKDVYDIEMFLKAYIKDERRYCSKKLRSINGYEQRLLGEGNEINWVEACHQVGVTRTTELNIITINRIKALMRKVYTKPTQISNMEYS